MAIYDFIYTVLIKVDKKKPVCAIFCDMTQAFDYVNHDILIKKLDAYGIRGNVLNLFKSYLNNRKQKTEITRINITTKKEEIHLSDEGQTIFGVPQGSVLGPPLFTLYINDLPKSTPHPMTLFADDSTVTISSNSNDMIQYKLDIHNTLTSMIEWFNNNNLKINLDKTKTIHFSQRLTVENMDINIDNKIVETVNSTKFLGLIIDKRLDWKSQIENLCKKICSSAFALHSLAAVVNVNTLIAAYHGLVASHLRYGIIFWGNSTDTGTAFKAQKRCIRSMFGLKTVDTCKPYFKKYKILTLPCIYILETAMFVKTNPNLFPRLQDVVPRNRRDMTSLRVYPAKTALMRKSIVCMAPTIFNKLPKRWKELNSKAFKRQLKVFLSQKAYYSVSEFIDEKVFFD